MILRRLGNKQAIASEIQKYFPPHKIYIEPFFGAGGMFFNKPKAKVNIMNDLDSDIYNLFNVIINNRDDLIYMLEIIPYSSEIFEFYRKNKEADPIKKAIRFIYLSNFGYMGKSESIKLDSRNHKENAIINLNKTIEFLRDCSIRFTNFDFRKAINSISLSEENNKDSAFFYCDPPYLNTDNNYSNSFTEQDSIDLFDTLQKTGCKWAMSEFDNEFILNQAKERGLNVHIIGERQNIKNRRTEILITNYAQHKTLFNLDTI